MLKFYYRLVYWKRRAGRAVGRRGPARPSYGGRGIRARTGRARARTHELRPLWVFAAIVAVVVVASAVIGAWSDPYYGTGMP